MTEPTTRRIKCPNCNRMVGQLARKIEGRYAGYARQDGSIIYTCPWKDCDVGDFTRSPAGRITNKSHKAVAT